MTTGCCRALPTGTRRRPPGTVAGPGSRPRPVAGRCRRRDAASPDRRQVHARPVRRARDRAEDEGREGHEVSAFVERLRSNGTRVELGDLAEHAVDMCGTGGDEPRRHVFNISTTAAFVAAGAGVPVAQHGTGAVSSDSGSSDVLGALGVVASTDPGEAAECLRALGITYMHAPAFNSGMRHLIGLRREIGLRSVFNLLGSPVQPGTGPPADHRDLRRSIPSGGRRRPAPARLGEAWVGLAGRDGLDELSTRAVTEVVEVRDGQVSSHEVDPRSLGLTAAPLEALAAATRSSTRRSPTGPRGAAPPRRPRWCC